MAHPLAYTTGGFSRQSSKDFCIETQNEVQRDSLRQEEATKEAWWKDESTTNKVKIDGLLDLLKISATSVATELAGVTNPERTTVADSHL
mgnify:FL=1